MEQLYSASAVSRPFWYVEFKKVMSLLGRGMSYEEIRAKVLEENLFDVAKEYRAKEIYGAVARRAKALDGQGVALFCNSDMATMKLIALIAIMQTDRLLAEFMNEVYREKIMMGDFELRDADFNTFFKRKQDQDEGMAGWKDDTLKKLRNSYINYLSEGGLVFRSGNTKTLTPPLLTEELKAYLQQAGLGAYISVFTGVR